MYTFIWYISGFPVQKRPARGDTPEIPAFLCVLCVFFPLCTLWLKSIYPAFADKLEFLSFPANSNRLNFTSKSGRKSMWINLWKI
jgi:hypothetical protein